MASLKLTFSITLDIRGDQRAGREVATEATLGGLDIDSPLLLLDPAPMKRGPVNALRRATTRRAAAAGQGHGQGSARGVWRDYCVRIVPFVRAGAMMR